MSETTSNYGLYITDDSSERFIEWRTQMNGTENSNMVKIDTALSEKANNSTSVSATLLANSWVGDFPFTQDISVSGLTATQNGSISLAQNATLDQRNSARAAMLSVAEQSDGTLTIVADGEKPEIDIPVVIVLID